MNKETTTGNPEYVGDCPICGYPCFRGVWHNCSTAPKLEDKIKHSCMGCEKEYEPDQYYAWCNKCGKRLEKEFWSSYFSWYKGYILKVKSK